MFTAQGIPGLVAFGTIRLRFLIGELEDYAERNPPPRSGEAPTPGTVGTAPPATPGTPSPPESGPAQADAGVVRGDSGREGILGLRSVPKAGPPGGGGELTTSPHPLAALSTSSQATEPIEEDRKEKAEKKKKESRKDRSRSKKRKKRSAKGSDSHREPEQEREREGRVESEGRGATGGAELRELAEEAAEEADEPIGEPLHLREGGSSGSGPSSFPVLRPREPSGPPPSRREEGDIEEREEEPIDRNQPPAGYSDRGYPSRHYGANKGTRKRETQKDFKEYRDRYGTGLGFYAERREREGKP